MGDGLFISHSTLSKDSSREDVKCRNNNPDFALYYRRKSAERGNAHDEHTKARWKTVKCAGKSREKRWETPREGLGNFRDLDPAREKSGCNESTHPLTSDKKESCEGV